jgi:endonuclease-3 related protein
MINSVYQKLFAHFGHQGWWPVSSKTGIRYHPDDYSHPKTEAERFEIILGAILTQNTSWTNVEKVITNLKNKNLLGKNQLKRIPGQRLASLIRSSGYYNQKSRKIREFLAYKGPVERQELLKIWGLGPETVDSMLLYAYNEPVFVIDAYTKRIFSRLLPEKTSRLKTYEEWRQFFESKLPKNTKIFKEYHALLVKLAKENCRKKPECAKCPLKLCCRYNHQ